MAKFLRLSGIALVSALFLTFGFVGCASTSKPNTEDMSKLNEAKAAAESAERKLSELRTERIALEKQLEGSEGAEQSEEQELDEIKDDAN